MTEASSYDTEEALIETIKGTFVGNDKTKVGEAFHKVLQGDFKTDGVKVLAGDVVFDKSQIVPGIKYALEHPLCVHEVPVRKVYETNYFPVQLSGKIDEINGITIRDAKCKFRNVDFKEYADSCQWKFYLDMTDTDRFFYDVFEVKSFKDLSGSSPYKLKPDVHFIAHDPLECIRYDSMEQDVQLLLNEFMDYLSNRNFFSLLKPAIAEETAFF